MIFKKELENHKATGYHMVNKYSENFDLLLRKEAIELNTEYIDFILDIGYGSFFAGALVLFPLYGDTGSIKALTEFIKKRGISDYIVIGYGGTTEGYYCLKNDSKDNSVYWLNLGTNSLTSLNDNFTIWINMQPKELFNPKIYLSFKEIKDVEGILRVIEERSFLDIELIDFDKTLVKPINKENDFLPRYNKVILAIRKTKNISLLNEVTIKFHRTNSRIKELNVEYLKLNIKEISLNKSTIIEGYLFDPFNMAFDSIECLYNPQIDLTTKMRVKYKEIIKFL